MEVRNRFKGLDLIDRVPDELWTEVRDVVQETGKEGPQLARRQGSQVSMRVARGSASWLSSHGRGLGPRDALKMGKSPNLSRLAF